MRTRLSLRRRYILAVRLLLQLVTQQVADQPVHAGRLRLRLRLAFASYAVLQNFWEHSPRRRL